MTGEGPETTGTQPDSELASAPPPPVLEHDAFWSYSDLILFAGLVIPCMLAGWAVVKLVFTIFHIHSSLKVVELLPEQLLGYGFLFGALAILLRVEYDRPFWRSFGWLPLRMAPVTIVACGI